MGIKRFIKNTCLKFIKPYIIFESYPDFSDNTRPVYDEFVRRGYEKKYNLVWYIENDKAAFLKDGVSEYWNPYDTSSLKNRIRCWGYFEKVKTVILCNRFILPYPIVKCDKSFYLSHGFPLKITSGYYTIPKCIDYCISPSEFSREIMAKNFSFDINRIIALGYPRNDILKTANLDLKELFKTDCGKTIVWYPTFRQKIGGLVTGSTNALPIIFDKKNALKINEVLKMERVLIIVKPHFAQDVSCITDLRLSNIRFIDDQFFEKNNISSYQFVGSCDALLTDYSSIYSDFLLCDRPIGLIWEDIEEYKKNPGLYYKYEEITEGTTKIYNLYDLILFIRNVANDIDDLKVERQRLRDKLNISTDGKNANRVVDFIVKKAGL